MSKNKVINFLNSIGIPTIKGYVPIMSFLPGILIKQGTLIYNGKATLGDMLHEAGHLAIVPGKYRKFMSGKLDRSIKRIYRMAKASDELDNPDAPIARQLMQASESEATAWAWAVGKFLNIAEEEIILDNTYEGKGANERAKLSANCHFGINGLRASGMVESVKTYPKLTRWVQP